MYIKALFPSRGKMYSGNDNDILILCNQLSPFMPRFKGHTCSYWHSDYRENENEDLILNINAKWNVYIQHCCKKKQKKKCFPKLHAKYAFLLFQMKLQLLIWDSLLFRFKFIFVSFIQGYFLWEIPYHIKAGSLRIGQLFPLLLFFFLFLFFQATFLLGF